MIHDFYSHADQVEELQLALERLNKDLATARVQMETGVTEPNVLDRIDRRVVTMRKLLQRHWHWPCDTAHPTPDPKTTKDLPEAENRQTTDLRAVV